MGKGMDMKNEIWRPVVGYEGLYEVSSHGRVKSLSRLDARGALRRERMLQPGTVTDSYQQVSLRRDGEAKAFLVHRLVALAFVANPEALPIINHKNGVRADNRAENLEWCSQLQNVRHSIEHLGRKPPRVYRGAEHGSSKRVQAVSAAGERLEFGNAREAAEHFGIDPSVVSRCCTGKREQAKGWRFAYAEAQA